MKSTHGFLSIECTVSPLQGLLLRRVQRQGVGWHTLCIQEHINLSVLHKLRHKMEQVLIEYLHLRI